MLAIIGPYPTEHNEKDGMVRRVQKIDDSFKGIKRIYLDISFKRISCSKRRIDNDVTVYWINFFIFFWFALYLCCKAKVIYVHSIYNSLKILPVYFFNKTIITDMHGVVVEEIKLNKKHSRFLIVGGVLIYKFVEWIAVKHSKRLVAVTETMKSYYVKKYNIIKDKIKVIPIFDSNQESIINRNKNIPASFIYSGGIQPWQCIDETINFVVKTSEKFKWTILSGNERYFKSRLSGIKFKYPITIKSVSPSEVKKYYLSNNFGIILREDNIVNRVACPTKLIEYIQSGLIPIVSSPYIGDFYDLGYKYITVDEIIHRDKYNKSKLNDMARVNYGVLRHLRDQTTENLKWLNNFIRDGLKK